MFDQDATPVSTWRRPAPRWVLAACLVVLAGLLVAGGLLLDRPATQPSPTVPETSASRPASQPAAPAAAPANVPVSISIPSIAASSGLVRLGIKEDRTVEVPSDADKAGWYSLGTIPGQPGSAVILGHVDSTEGPAVFYRLRELVAGAQVHVTRADGAVETFEVVRMKTIDNDSFPARKIYAGTPHRPTLSIVTCGGDYDADNGGYQSNVIAFTEHIGTEPAA